MALVGGLHSHANPDGPALRDALEKHGLVAEAPAWNDPRVDWSAYAMAVAFSTWDYTADVEAFRVWATATGNATILLNSPDVLAWNSDKHYLADLADAGVPTVPTTFVEPGQGSSPPSHAEYVLKPAVSADAESTARFRLGADDAAAAAHARRILRPGAQVHGQTLSDARALMVQPYLAAVATEGEHSLIYLGGELSHVNRKGGALAFGHAPADRDEYDRQLQTLPASADEVAVAEQALAAVPGNAVPAYARVDLVRDDAGALRLLELELIEPWLRLHTAPGSAERLAAVLADRLQSARGKIT